MYPSGVWRGFWEQPHFGRQAMSDFRLRFAEGAIDGDGVDVVGRFTFRGAYDERGQVRLVKQYIDRHAVLYVGTPDGEGSIAGTWTVSSESYSLAGPFVMQPVFGTSVAGMAIQEIVK